MRLLGRKTCDNMSSPLYRTPSHTRWLRCARNTERKWQNYAPRYRRWTGDLRDGKLW